MRVPMIGGPADGLEYEMPEPLPQSLIVQGEPGPVERWAGGDTVAGYRVEWPMFVYWLGTSRDPSTGQERPAYAC